MILYEKVCFLFRLICIAGISVPGELYCEFSLPFCPSELIPTVPQPYPNGSKGFIECLHPVRTVPAHGFGHMGVFIQRECRGEVSHVLLHRLHIITGPQRRNRICMPLWYNRKKRRSPYFTRVCAVCRCEISPFPALKWQRKICPRKEVCYANTKKQAKSGTK